MRLFHKKIYTYLATAFLGVGVVVSAGFLGASFLGCAPFFYPWRAAASGSQEEQGMQTVTDATGKTIEIPIHPRRVVILDPPDADLYTAAGGVSTIVGKPTTKNFSPDVAQKLAAVPDVGILHQPNAEAILGLHPDLVITIRAPINNGLADILEKSGVPLYTNQLDSYEDAIRSLQFFGALTGKEDTASKAAQELTAERARAISRGAGRVGPKTLILVSASKSTQAATSASFSGSLAKELGARNIADNTAAEGAALVQLSQEEIAGADPDVIFIITIGKNQDASKTLAESMKSDPAWSTISAVQQGRVYPLPQSLFLVNPGMRMGNAMNEMATALWGN